MKLIEVPDDFKVHSFIKNHTISVIELISINKKSVTLNVRFCDGSQKDIELRIGNTLNVAADVLVEEIE